MPHSLAVFGISAISHLAGALHLEGCILLIRLLKFISRHKKSPPFRDGDFADIRLLEYEKNYFFFSSSRSLASLITISDTLFGQAE